MAEVRIQSWLHHDWVIANDKKKVRSAIATWVYAEVYGLGPPADLVGRSGTAWVYTSGLRVRFDVLRYEANARRPLVVHLVDINPRIEWQHPQMPPAIMVARGLAWGPV